MEKSPRIKTWSAAPTPTTTPSLPVWKPILNTTTATLDDAAQSYRFEIDAVTRSLRFDVITSNGGNTGLIEFVVYGTPL